MKMQLYNTTMFIYNAWLGTKLMYVYKVIRYNTLIIYY